MIKFFHQMHLYISLFFLPLALFYAITGSLYILGVTDKVGVKNSEIELTSPLPKSNSKILSVMEKTLTEKGFSMPSGTELKNGKNGLSIGGLKYSVSIKNPTSDHPILVVTERGIWSNLVLLHKAKGAFYFNILAIAFSVALILLYLSGFIIVFWCKAHRKSSIAVLGSGFLIMVLFILMSI